LFASLFRHADAGSGHTYNLSDLLIRDQDTTFVRPVDDSSSISVRSFIESPLFSEAKDSIIEDFTNGKKLMYYFGDVKVKYQNLEMSAENMVYDADTRIVYATGVADSTGKLQGRPEMKEGNSTYTMDSIYYNFTSKKAKIYGMKTQDKDGFLHGNVLKKMPDNSLNISDGMYTTCDADHPHFYLRMTAAKVVQSPKKTIFGPSYLVIEDVPTPFALPFGFVPDRPDRASGLMMPSFGEEVSRGFFMKELGYYFVAGNHLDFALTGDFYTLGSWRAQLDSRYKSLYRFDGSIQLNSSTNITGERGAPDYNESKDFSVRWSHNQDPKARPGTTFRASVNFSSPMNNRYNATNINQARESSAQSSISYAKTFFGTPFNLSVNLQHSQNMRDSSYAFTLPNFSLSMSTIFPFKRKERVGKELIYEKISFGYNTSFDNKINFKSSDFSSGDVWSKFKNGMSHSFKIGLPTFNLLQYLQFSPNISYGMNWHFRSKEWIYNRETGKEEEIVTDPFSVLGITQNVSGSLAMSTIVYGMYEFKEGGPILAIRHMVKPNVSINFSPNMRTAMNGYTSLDYTDTLGKERTRLYNIYDGSTAAILGGPKSASMSFSLGNNVEAKVRDRKDTTSSGIKKIKLIDNLQLSSSYNFLLDSFKLAPVSVSMNTTIFEKVNLQANAMLDPYAIHKHGSAKIATYNIVQEGGFKLLRLTAAGMSFSYQFSGKGAGGTSAENSYKRIFVHPITGEFIPDGYIYYMPPDLPWSVNFSYNYTYSVAYQYANASQQKIHNHLQTLSVNSQLKLTKDFNLTLSTGVDMMKMALTTTNLAATYDLHCFLISVNWIPNGKWSSWSFRIQAKSSALADLLKYDKKASFWDM
jgi:hypothetical protein